MPKNPNPPPRPAPRYDAVIKDLFQHDQPTIADELRDGVPIRTSLNVEFAKVEERRADLLWLLETGVILHIEFQSENDPAMPYRVGIYGLSIARKYRRQLRQVVLYLGADKMQMADSLDLGEISVRYRLINIHELDAEALLQSGRPGDLVLAMLARGGKNRLQDILKQAALLSGPNRDRVLAQMLALSGLRKLSPILTMEVRRMGLTIDIEKNVFLKEIRDTALEQGRAEGREEGREEGLAYSLQHLLSHKFGPLPRWARQRIENASPKTLEKWLAKVITAPTLEAAIGKR